MYSLEYWYLSDEYVVRYRTLKGDNAMELVEQVPSYGVISSLRKVK